MPRRWGQEHRATDSAQLGRSDPAACHVRIQDGHARLPANVRLVGLIGRGGLLDRANASSASIILMLQDRWYYYCPLVVFHPSK